VSAIPNAGWEHSAMPTTDDELKSLLFAAVRAYMCEWRLIGGTRSLEHAVSVRVAMQLSRMHAASDWEANGITVDAEYSQSGTEGALKGKLKPDLIVHRRGEKGPENNWLACEIKMHGARPRRTMHPGDRSKLIRCKTEFLYRVAIWISIPRSREGHPPVYSEIVGLDATDVVPIF
jgi:hypothetical protein